MKLGFGLGLFVKFGNEKNLKIGNNIDTFFEFCKSEKNPEIYFHNLKFDGEFILSWLYDNDFRYDEYLSTGGTFRILRPETGLMYEIEIRFLSKNKGKMYFFTRYGTHTPHELKLNEKDVDYYFVIGKESTGIPKEILKDDMLSPNSFSLYSSSWFFSCSSLNSKDASYRVSVFCK